MSLNQFGISIRYSSRNSSQFFLSMELGPCAVGGPSAVEGHVAVDEVRRHVGQGQVRYHHLLLRIHGRKCEIPFACQGRHNKASYALADGFR